MEKECARGGENDADEIFGYYINKKSNQREKSPSKHGNGKLKKAKY